MTERVCCIPMVMTTLVMCMPLDAKPEKERLCELAKWELEVDWKWTRSCDLASCQVSRQSNVRAFNVSMLCIVDSWGHNARVQTRVNLDKLPAQSMTPFQKELVEVMRCNSNKSPYSGSPDTFYGPALQELLFAHEKYKDREFNGGRAADIFGVEIGGVYFQRAESCGGDSCSFSILTAEPEATVEDVRIALGWVRADLSREGFLQKIEKAGSAVTVTCEVLPAVDPKSRKVVAPAGLIMRERPSQSSRQKTFGPEGMAAPVLIPHGRVVTVLACNGPLETISGRTANWCEVGYLQQLGVYIEGWVFGGFLEPLVDHTGK